MQLGDYVLTSEVQSREGAARYRQMAEYANCRGYMIEEQLVPLVDPYRGDLKDMVHAYVITELSVPDGPSARESMIEEMARIDAEFRDLDYIGIKIATGRGSISEYRAEIQRMDALAERKNALQEELKRFDDLTKVKESVE